MYQEMQAEKLQLNISNNSGMSTENYWSVMKHSLLSAAEEVVG